MKKKLFESLFFILKGIGQKSWVPKVISALCLIFFSALCAWSWTESKKINTRYSFEGFFPKHHPLLQQSQNIRQRFQLSEKSTFLVSVSLKDIGKTQNGWLSSTNMTLLREITDRLENLSNIRQVLSIANVEGAISEDGNLYVGPIFESLPEKNWSTYTKKNFGIKSQLISSDFKTALIVVEPTSIPADKLAVVNQSIEKAVLKVVPNAQVLVGGSPAIQGEFSAQLLKDIKIFFFLSLIVFCLVVLSLLTGWTTLGLTFLALCVTNLVVVASISYLKIPFSVLLSTLPIIVSITVLSNIVHTMHRWAEAKLEFPFIKEFPLSVRVIKEMWMPNFLGALTTAIGFAVLAFSDAPLISQYGKVVACSVLGVWLLSQFLLFSFLYITKPRLRDWTKRKSVWAIPLLKHSAPFVALTILVAAMFTILGRQANFSGRLFDDLPKGSQARVATEEIDRNFGGVVPYELVLTGNRPDFWSDPKSLRKLSQLATNIRQLKSVGSVTTVTDLLGYPLPTKKDSVSETYFLFSLSPSNPLRSYLVGDNRSVRLSLRFHDVPSNSIHKTRRQTFKLIQKYFGNIKVEEGGMAANSHTINSEISESLVKGFWHSIILIGLLLVFIFKSLRWALLACIPNLIPPIVLIGTLGITQTPIKPGVALIFSIALGLAFNNTVYLLTRLNKIMQNRGMSNLPIRRALIQEGNPCLFETLVMLAGFSIFLLSKFEANQLFGIYLSLSVMAGAIADLVFLPSFIKLFPQILKEKRIKETAPMQPRVLNRFPTKLDQPKPNNKPYPDLPQIGGFLLLAFLVFNPWPQANAAKVSSEAKSILQKVQKKLDAKNDSAIVQMKVIEANGDTTEKVVNIKTLKSNSFFFLARIQSPSDIKGTAFLSEIKGDEESQWLYLPSNRQVRRVVGTNKTSGILGSELTSEDLNSTAIKNSTVKIKKRNKKSITLETTPLKGTSAYDKVVTTISLPSYLPSSTAYFSKRKLVKTVKFNEYRKVGKNTWRAQKIQVKNLKNKRGTDLAFTDLTVNASVSEGDFSVNALKRGH